MGPSPRVTCQPPSLTLYTRCPSEMDGPNVTLLSMTWKIFALEYPPRRKSSRSKSWEGANSAVKERLRRWPLTPHVLGIHVPGSLPILKVIFHLVSSNKLLIPFFTLFFAVFGFESSDELVLLVKTIGAGEGNNPSSSFPATVCWSEDTSSDADDVALDNCSSKAFKRRNASSLNSSISFRNFSDSASISWRVGVGGGAMKSGQVEESWDGNTDDWRGGMTKVEGSNFRAAADWTSRETPIPTASNEKSNFIFMQESLSNRNTWLWKKWNMMIKYCRQW